MQAKNINNITLRYSTKHMFGRYECMSTSRSQLMPGMGDAA